MKAIVIYYTGKEASNYIIGKIAELLITTGVAHSAEQVKVSTLDDSDLAAIITEKVIKKKAEKEDTKESYAITYISKFFETEIHQGGIQFALALSNELIKDNCPKELKNAVDIIVNTTVFTSDMFSKSILNMKHINIIKSIYSINKDVF